MSGRLLVGAASNYGDWPALIPQKEPITFPQPRERNRAQRYFQSCSCVALTSCVASAQFNQPGTPRVPVPNDKKKLDWNFLVLPITFFSFQPFGIWSLMSFATGRGRYKGRHVVSYIWFCVSFVVF